MSDDATPAKVRLNDGLGPLPPRTLAEIHNPATGERELSETGTAYYGSNWREVRKLYTADDMRAYAAEQVAAERERCDVLTDNMLRYAMAAIGTGSPADAARFRLFWRFAIEARNTKA